MAVLNFNIPDVLEQKLREYSREQGITMTSIVQQALIDYFNDLEVKDKVQDMLVELFKDVVDMEGLKAKRIKLPKEE